MSAPESRGGYAGVAKLFRQVMVRVGWCQLMAVGCCQVMVVVGAASTLTRVAPIRSERGARKRISVVERWETLKVRNVCRWLLVDGLMFRMIIDLDGH